MKTFLFRAGVCNLAKTDGVRDRRTREWNRFLARSTARNVYTSQTWGSNRRRPGQRLWSQQLPLFESRCTRGVLRGWCVRPWKFRQPSPLRKVFAAYDTGSMCLTGSRYNRVIQLVGLGYMYMHLNKGRWWLSRNVKRTISDETYHTLCRSRSGDQLMSWSQWRTLSRNRMGEKTTFSTFVI